MPTLIKAFSDNSILEYDEGSFDSWCVYCKPLNLPRYAPKDVDYFSVLARMGLKHGCENVYNDFTAIFERTTKTLDPSLLNDITQSSIRYAHDDLVMNKLFSILYAGMVAEENKANTKLGKKVKRLGVHQVLIDRMKPEDAAAFSKGMIVNMKSGSNNTLAPTSNVPYLKCVLLLLKELFAVTTSERGAAR